MTKEFTVSCVGCCLVDRLYNNISFDSGAFLNYRSRNSGDGGLNPGHLVFKDEFEKFRGEKRNLIFPYYQKYKKQIGG